MVACGSSPIIDAAGIVLDLDQRYQRGPLFVLNEVRKVSFDLYELDSTD